jgi:hypothetical protein
MILLPTLNRHNIKYAFLANKSDAGNTGNAAYAKATLTDEQFDYGNCYDVSTSRFTAPATGLYFFGGRVTTSNNGWSSLRVRCYINGSPAPQRSQELVFASTNGNADMSVSVDTVQYLTKDDYVELWTFGNTTLALRPDSRCYWYGFYLGSLS